MRLRAKDTHTHTQDAELTSLIWAPLVTVGDICDRLLLTFLSKAVTDTHPHTHLLVCSLTFSFKA